MENKIPKQKFLDTDIRMVVTQIFLHWSPDPHIQTLRRCWMMCEFIWYLALSWHLGSLECLPAGPYQSPQRGDGRTPARISCVAFIADKPTRRTRTPGEAPPFSMGSSSQAKLLTSPHSIWKTNKISWELWMDQTKAVQDVYTGAPLIHLLSPFPITGTSTVSLGTWHVPWDTV